MEEAGADAIELNIYAIVTDPNDQRRGSRAETTAIWCGR